MHCTCSYSHTQSDPLGPRSGAPFGILHEWHFRSYLGDHMSSSESEESSDGEEESSGEENVDERSSQEEDGEDSEKEEIVTKSKSVTLIFLSGNDATSYNNDPSQYFTSFESFI